MNGRNRLPLRIAAVSTMTAVVGAIAALPAAAAEGDVSVVNTETVQVYTDATGAVETKRIYEQIAATGDGVVDLRNPVETDGLRNLDGFGGFDVEDGYQVTEMTVDGEQRLRTVSDYPGDLPLEVSVKYFLDGEPVEPGDVVGESGRLEVQYTVKNVTGVEQEVTFDDGTGGTVTKTVEVPIPMVGSLTTVAPPSYTDVRSEQANIAGDGKGGTKLSFTMTLFPPIGSDTVEFGYTANIVDGVIPRATVSALPVNPLESTSFKTAGESYKGGAETGIELTDGASQIDANLLKLRDGAGELLAGLIKLRDGSEQLEAGLSGEAVPGADRLADGAGQLSDGVGQLSDGLGQIDDGAGRLADGSGRLAAGTGEARTGSEQLSDGLGLISGGLAKLADAESGLPAAKSGADQLKAGVDLLISKLGTVDDPATLIGGLAKLETGLGALEAGAGQLSGGLSLLRGNGSATTPGLVAAKGGVDLVKSGLDASLAPGGSLDQLNGGLGLINSVFCPANMVPGSEVMVPAAPTIPAAYVGLTCPQVVGALQAGVADSRTKLGTASAGLGQVSTGLATALGALDTRLIPGANQIAAGLTNAKTGSTTLKNGAIQFKGGMQQVSGGLVQLSDGLTTAVAGVLRLSDGADTAFAGSRDLAAGLGLLDDGAGELADGAGQLADGTGQAADGAVRAADGADQVADGAGQLADGLKDAANGSSRLAAGLGEAAAGAPKLKDGAQRLSDEGTKKLVEAGESTAQNYGELYAVIEAGAERADAEKMVYGAPEGAIGLAAYSYEIQGEDGEGGRNAARGLGGLAVLAAGAGALALRRRFI